MPTLKTIDAGTWLMAGLTVVGWIGMFLLSTFKFESRVETALDRFDRSEQRTESRLEKIEEKLDKMVSSEDFKDERDRILNSVAAIEMRCCE